MLKNTPLNVGNPTLGTTGNDDQATPLVTGEQVLDFSKLLTEATAKKQVDKDQVPLASQGQSNSDQGSPKLAETKQGSLLPAASEQTPSAGLESPSQLATDDQVASLVTGEQVLDFSKLLTEATAKKQVDKDQVPLASQGQSNSDQGSPKLAETKQGSLLPAASEQTPSAGLESPSQPATDEQVAPKEIVVETKEQLGAKLRPAEVEQKLSSPTPDSKLSFKQPQAPTETKPQSAAKQVAVLEPRLVNTAPQVSSSVQVAPEEKTQLEADQLVTLQTQPTTASKAQVEKNLQLQLGQLTPKASEQGVSQSTSQELISPTPQAPLTLEEQGQTTTLKTIPDQASLTTSLNPAAGSQPVVQTEGQSILPPLKQEVVSSQPTPELRKASQQALDFSAQPDWQLASAKTSAQLELGQLEPKARVEVNNELEPASPTPKLKPVKVVVALAQEQATNQLTTKAPKQAARLASPEVSVATADFQPGLTKLKVSRLGTKLTRTADEQVDLGQLALLTSAAFRENLVVANGQTKLQTNLPSQVQEISLTTGQTKELTTLAHKIVAGLENQNLGEHKTLVLQIKPERLGKMEVKFRAAGERFTLEFKVETKETKAILEAVSDKLQKIIDKQLSPSFSQALNLQAPSEPLKVSPSSISSEATLGQFDFDQGQSQQRQFGQTHQLKKANPKQAVSLVEASPANPQATGQVSILV